MPVKLGELASQFNCELVGDPDVVIDSVASLNNAGPGSLSFLSNAKFKQQLSSSKAAAVIVRADDAGDAPVPVLISDDPYVAYAKIAAVVHPQRAPDSGVHPGAVVAPDACVPDSASVGANVVIDENVTLGENVRIDAGCYVGRDCTVGDNTQLLPNVTLVRAVVIGKRCIVHSGAVIGADGFGNAKTPDGWLKVPQLGGVCIGDDVEIGANTTIDCGALGDTTIEDGVRIDNLCMIAHNVRIGAHTALAAMSGIAGSTTIGKRCMFGGQAGSVGHISICDDVTVWGQGMISKDITEPGTYASSFPADTAHEWNKLVARVRRLDALYTRVRKLEKGTE